MSERGGFEWVRFGLGNRCAKPRFYDANYSWITTCDGTDSPRRWVRFAPARVGFRNAQILLRTRGVWVSDGEPLISCTIHLMYVPAQSGVTSDFWNLGSFCTIGVSGGWTSCSTVRSGIGFDLRFECARMVEGERCGLRALARKVREAESGESRALPPAKSACTHQTVQHVAVVVDPHLAPLGSPDSSPTARRHTPREGCIIPMRASPVEMNSG